MTTSGTAGTDSHGPGSGAPGRTGSDGGGPGRGIPFVDLAGQHAEVREAVERGWAEVISRTSFVLGPQVAAFESEFAAFSQVRHCIGVGNGTDALELAVRAAGIGAGDEVLIPVNTFIASAVAVARAGATPVFVDSDPATHLIDVADAAARVTARTRAIMPVHLFGQMAPMAAVAELADRHGLVIVEDGAQSQGATQNQRPWSGRALVAATSFYPGKNLGAYGDAGAVLTDDDGVADRVRRLRNYGSQVKYEHPEVGFNSRLDSMQAVVLSAKLRRLPDWNKRRRQAACRYHDALADLGVTLPVTAAGNEHVWHLYVIRVADRDRVVNALSDQGIGIGIHYPIPLHLLGAYAHLGHQSGDFPVAEAAAREILSLPMHPHLRPSDQDRVAEALASALHRP